MLGPSREIEEAFCSLSPHHQRLFVLRYLCRMPVQQLQEEAQRYGEEHIRRLFNQQRAEQQIPGDEFSWLV